MNKIELISAVSANTGFTKKDIGTVVDAMTTVIEKTLSNGEKVSLVGFGTFEVSTRKAREGRNPQTGETISIAASKAPKFKAGSGLKAAVKGE